MTTATSIRVPANGLEHHVLEWSPERPGGRTVFLVHGYMDAGGTWAELAPALTAAGHRVVAPDMRGFGAGARVSPGGYYHFVDYVFDLADLVEVLAPGEPIGLVGHSMGGTIATLFAGTFPERVERLVNMEGVGPPSHPWELGPVRMRAWIDQVRDQRRRGQKGKPTFTKEEALKRLAMNHPNVAPAILARCLPHLAQDAGEGRVAWHFDPLHRTTSPVPFFAELFVEFAKKVTCPVLFVSGGPQGYHPPDEAERLAAFARLERAELPSAGHMLHWTQPEALGPILVDFLSAAPAPP
ncbi:MAG: alpha/beta hydrolase [Deltaproteobacteria bacterium]|nr:alpha/beta hydrolase [Deltaproteobacteria bacterium]